MEYYTQQKDCSWLDTPKGTIWITFLVTDDGYYIQPEEKSLITTMYGVNLQLLSDSDLLVFKHLQTINI